MNKATKIVLTGQAQSTNHIYKMRCAGNTPRTYMTKEGTALKEQYQWEAKSQWRGKPRKGPISLSIILYFGDNRRRDIDNYHKLSLDALEGIVYEDDSQINELSVIKAKDIREPRIEIYVAKLADLEPQ